MRAIPGENSPTPVGDVWLRPARAHKGDPPLTRARITEAAVALLDDEGMDRLTMRRLAERLDAGATTLYWHVSTKDDVIDLAVDAIFGEATVPSPTGSPRADVTALLHAWRAAMLRHPWSAAVPARRRPLIGPRFLAWMEFLQSALVRTGLPAAQVNPATWALYNHVMGSVSGQIGLRLPAAELEAGRRHLQSVAAEFPTVAAHNYIADTDWDAAFSSGLGFLLDGITAHAG
ncbi:TetR family transcriptional regulator [Actinorhabdospora filicis]|uniref:TetR family transcriptional regulator n=1 Tax=Actinorhabdospora filicis TaxID=1785913 RepID=A0A9W6WB16_9ACTN|nr:TetR/AcrR family transcriptional regulator C-terminal domain-containing protein [Actinorhabdospora filicis]GLZ79613.1 TetR family transcriptional regulator [Actinorhabdospora filicis]